VFDLLHGPGWVAVVVVVVVVLVVVVVFTLENRLLKPPKKKPWYSNPKKKSGAKLAQVNFVRYGFSFGSAGGRIPRLKNLLDP